MVTEDKDMNDATDKEAHEVKMGIDPMFDLEKLLKVRALVDKDFTPEGKKRIYHQMMGEEMDKLFHSEEDMTKSIDHIYSVLILLFDLVEDLQKEGISIYVFSVAVGHWLRGLMRSTTSMEAHVMLSKQVQGAVQLQPQSMLQQLLSDIGFPFEGDPEGKVN